MAQNNIVVQEDIFKKGVVDKLSMVCLTNESFVLSAKVRDPPYLYILNSCVIHFDDECT